VWVLGIDTATRVGSVGLLRDGDIVAEESRPPATGGHNETLFAMIGRVLRRAGLEFGDVGALAVSNGPGSFTGLRIGLSAAKGLAFAGGKKLVAVSTLEALARSVEAREGPLCACLDARRQEVYLALFEAVDGGVRRVGPDMVTAPGEAAAVVAPGALVVGDGPARYENLMAALLRRRARVAEGVHPRGGVVARMGWERLRRGECDDPGALVPFYLRSPLLRAS
jgi:tRNA threonylcarbamoyladenosine biosynthesis protein TsaB